ncbi:MAG: hypothetical protein OXH11_07815 [Candidatus Aminicenantes bacterium]|nr:hypothetical protein [Candidatus Aminicenantes bacterium]
MAHQTGRTISGVFTVLLLCGGVQAQEPEPVRLVDSPTAGLTSKGRFGIDMRLFSNGGVTGEVNAGILKRIAIGLSFGGTGIIGDDEVSWYPRVEAAARYRVIEESSSMPGVAIGYETQGYGAYEEKRYQIKSKGLFAAFSKNYASALGQFGLHAGINLTREDEEDGDLSGWVGVDKSIGRQLSIVGEYDLALNDNEDDSLGSGKGYLNVGAYWSAVPNIGIGVLLKNVLRNREDPKTGVPILEQQLSADPDVSREISIRYTEEF